MSGWRIKGTAGALANQAWPLRDHLGFERADDGRIRVSEEPAEDSLAVLSLAGVAAPRLQRRDAGIVLQVNGVDWQDGVLQLGDEIRIDTLRFLLQAPGKRPERVLAPDHRTRAPSRRWAWTLALAVVAVLAAAAAWWLLR